MTGVQTCALPILSKTESMFENEDIKLILKKDDVDLNDINKVATVRLTGMKILDMNKLPRLGKYHGILFMKGLKVNDYFRKLENATHSNWSADRIQNTAEAEQKILALRSFVRRAINELMAGAVLEEVNATGVGETLPDEDEIANDNDVNRNESIEDEVIKTIKITEKPPRKLKEEEKKNTEEETEEVALELDENGQIIKKGPISIEPIPPVPSPPDPNPMPSEEHEYSELNKKVLPKKIRLIGKKDNYKLVLSLNDNEKTIKIDVDIYGESGTEKAKISKGKCYVASRLLKSTLPIEIKNNSIILKNLTSESVYNIEFSIESDGIWPLEVKVYGEK